MGSIPNRTACRGSASKIQQAELAAFTRAWWDCSFFMHVWSGKRTKSHWGRPLRARENWVVVLKQSIKYQHINISVVRVSGGTAAVE